MLYINEAEEIEQLRKMSLYLNADFIEGVDSAKLEFDNEFGKGKISTFIVFPGLIAKSYDIKLAKELKFNKRKQVLTLFTLFIVLKGTIFMALMMIRI